MTHMLVLLLSLPSLAFSLPSIPYFEKPICNYGDACNMFHPNLPLITRDMDFTFCECSHNRKCSKSESHSLVLPGTEVMYSFCEEPKFPTCEPGQISSEINFLVTNHKCICPEGMVNKQEQIGLRQTAFVCDYPLPQCKSGQDICGYYDGSKTLNLKCGCPSGYGCIYQEMEMDSQLALATCQRVL